MKPLPLLLFLALFSTRLFAATADTPAAAATPAGQESLYERSEAQIKAGYDKMQTRESTSGMRHPPERVVMLNVSEAPHVLCEALRGAQGDCPVAAPSRSPMAS